MRAEQQRIRHADRYGVDCLPASFTGLGLFARPLEIVLVSIGVVALLRLCHWASGHWVSSLSPFALVMGAVLPTLARGGDLSGLGLHLGRIRRGILLLGASGVCMLVLGFIGLVVLRYLTVEPPLMASIPKERWPLWVLFQFVCVAFPEELFFRGYFLSNSLYLFKTNVKMDASTAGLLSVVLSAGVFALSHVLVLGDPVSALTFFPGLIFGWLFVRMGTLTPSILLHGTANVSYVMMGGMFM